MPDPAPKRFSSMQAYRPLRAPETVEDKDACGIYAAVNKGAKASHDTIQNALTALEKMLHRAGNVDGEGDGCGVLIDIPRKIWAEEIRTGGHASKLALDPRFAVVHMFIPRKGGGPAPVQQKARDLMSKVGLRVLAERENAVDSSALGPHAREEEPVFWQVGGLIEDPVQCFDLTLQLEESLDVHVASCSTSCAVYKVLGAPGVLGRYYPDLHDPRAETVSLLGHNRYSTNTWPSFKRVQPFGVLGHNGEINTIARLRQEARMLGVPIHTDGSDSQDFSRTVESLIYRHGLTLVEALELTLPPIVDEIKGLPADLRGFYMYLRQAFGPFAQGPVALISRFADEHVFSVDALGLRPLWQIETADGVLLLVRARRRRGQRASPASPSRSRRGRRCSSRSTGRRAGPRFTTTARCRRCAPSGGASAPDRRRATSATPARSSPAARSRARRSPATPAPARRSRSRWRTACWAASAGSART